MKINKIFGRLGLMCIFGFLGLLIGILICAMLMVIGGVIIMCLSAGFGFSFHPSQQILGIIGSIIIFMSMIVGMVTGLLENNY